MSSGSDDTSDEEYKPQEVESDVPSDAETDYDSDGNKIDKTKLENKGTKRRKSQKKGINKRQHSNNVTEKEIEKKKDELEEDDEEEKRKTEALWASFLNDTNSSSSHNKIEKENEKAETSSDTKEKGVKNVESETDATIEKKPVEKFVTKVFDFAGEEVKVTEKVKESEPAPQHSTSSNSKAPVKPKFGFGTQRSSGGVLGSVLSQLGKKGKISTLEKTKLDWMNYKKNEGIEEELQTHNKGKDGYLERQDFLERTDLRQFERERELRQSKRSNR